MNEKSIAENYVIRLQMAPLDALLEPQNYFDPLFKKKNFARQFEYEDSLFRNYDYSSSNLINHFPVPADGGMAKQIICLYKKESIYTFWIKLYQNPNS